MTDIIIFGGQSNMQGQTESIPYEYAVCGGYEYKYLSDSIVPLRHPVGEDVGDDLLLAAHEGKGSLVPSFVRAYAQASGSEVVAIHAAKGATRIDEWEKGSERYNAALKKILGGIKLVKSRYDVKNIAYVWLQGESDAIAGTSQKEYLDRLTEYKNALVRDAGINIFGIIKVGYFVRTAADEEIMAAQEQACLNKGFTMLTRVCPELSLNPAYLNPYAAGHYNNAGMEIIGTLAGQALHTRLSDKK